VFAGDKRVSDLGDYTYTAYLGTQTQSADPRLVQDLGELAPAFRNTAYLAITGTMDNVSVPAITAEISGRHGGLSLALGDNMFGYDAWVSAGVVMSDGSWLLTTHHNCHLYRSIDYGATWTQIPSMGLSEGVWFNNVISPEHPGVPGRVYFTSMGPYSENCIYRSDDYGLTFPIKSAPLVDPERGEPAGGSIVFGKAGDPNTVYYVSQGFLWGAGNLMWMSTDGGLTYHVTHNFERGAFNSIAGIVQQGDTLWAMGGGDGQIYRGDANGGGFDTVSVNSGSTNGSGGGAFAVNGQVAMFGGGDGSVWQTETGGESVQTGYGADGPIYSPGWTTYPTGLTTIGGMAVNSMGIAVAVGTIGSSFQAVYSLDYGHTWTWHPPATDELDGNFYDDFWPGIGAVFLTLERFCVGYGALMGPPRVTCQKPILPSSCGNPAAIVLDLLTHPRYGLGLTTMRMDMTSVMSCSYYCLEQIPTGLASSSANPFPAREQRFCLDYILDNQLPIVDHLRNMLATFRGYLCFSQGKVKMKIERPETTAQSFGMGQIIANTFQWKKQSLRERPNVVRVEYIEPGGTVIDATGKTANSDKGRFVTDMEGSTADLERYNAYTGSNYKSYKADFVEASNPWDIERTGERRERVLNLTGIKRRTQAYRMADFYLSKAIHCQHACSFRVGINALKAEVGDVIAVSHDVPRWAGKLFRLVEIQEAESDELTLGCLEYNEALFNDALAAAPHGQDPITGNTPPWGAAPEQVGRLTTYERPGDNSIEITYTRIATADMFGGAGIYKRIGSYGAWQLIGTQISNAPTAFLASHLETVTLVQSLEG
jgi:hypothetical protein